MNLGSGATTKVKQQIDEAVKLTNLDEEWHALMLQIMLAGHDGSHPHLPEMNPARAGIALQLLRDLTYQLYTRPGKIREAAKLRQDVIHSSAQRVDT